MEFLTLINWTSPFPFKGLVGCILIFYSNFKRTFCKQTDDPDHTSHRSASGPSLYFYLRPIKRTLDL